MWLTFGSVFKALNDVSGFFASSGLSGKVTAVLRESSVQWSDLEEKEEEVEDEDEVEEEEEEEEVEEEQEEQEEEWSGRELVYAISRS